MPQPFRVFLGEGLGAVVVEAQTAEDAVRLQQAYSQSKRQSVTPPVSRPTLFNRSPKPIATVVFKNGHYKGFEALYAAGDGGVHSEELARLMGLSGVTSLPPTVGAWGKRAAGVGVNLSELLEVERRTVSGKMQTIYRLTPKGREVFRPETEQARAANDSGLS